MDDKKILEENGWKVECESPFEISTKDGSFATNEAASMVAECLNLTVLYNRLHLIKDAYKADLIDKDTFVSKIISTIENNQ